MADRRSLRRSWPPGIKAVLAPHVRLAGLALLAAAPLFAISALVPRAVFLPSVSLAAIGGAAVAAFAAWWLGVRRNGPTVTLWDVAGACVLIGCAAAMLSEPDAILKTMERNPSP
ncbi:MAG: hypothetical protein ACK4UO_09655 [Pseudolabrys sp.]